MGAANFANPRAMETIADEMAQWMDAHGVKTLEEIRAAPEMLNNRADIPE